MTSKVMLKAGATWQPALLAVRLTEIVSMHDGGSNTYLDVLYPAYRTLRRTAFIGSDSDSRDSLSTYVGRR